MEFEARDMFKNINKRDQLICIAAGKVSKTPTFFVNKKALESFGPDQLYQLIVDEINKAN
ncbi:hypothetical protein OLMES_2877 [Oleiphilus messinensis]|uniref:Thioredoxin-like fold domain-containing protein n=1 Tax=Oleiphilus messinensis TaxID=141451 RepID=A0A1Y0IBT7_9GAMM|nr:hypothetical protein OLMES_2877 [Oleiphilus messinensis]